MGLLPVENGKRMYWLGLMFGVDRKNCKEDLEGSQMDGNLHGGNLDCSTGFGIS